MTPQANRVGKRQVAAHFPEAQHRQLKVLAAELGVTMQALLEGAVNDLFRRYGRPAFPGPSLPEQVPKRARNRPSAGAPATPRARRPRRKT